MSAGSSFTDMLPEDRLRGIAKILAVGVHRCVELERLAKLRDSEKSADAPESLSSPLELPRQTWLTVSGNFAATTGALDIHFGHEFFPDWQLGFHEHFQVAELANFQTGENNSGESKTTDPCYRGAASAPTLAVRKLAKHALRSPMKLIM